MKTNSFILLMFGVVLVGCATKGPSFDPREHVAPAFVQPELTNSIDRSSLQPPTEPYRLGPGDVIEVESVGDSAARASLTVGPDGKIYYSLLPGLKVSDLTLAQTAALLASELGKFTRTTPELLVGLRTAASKRVWLMGTANAGLYPLAAPTTLLELVSAMGGLPSSGPDDLIDLRRSFVMREGKRLPVDFERLFKQGDLSQNIYLAPDDFVFLRPAQLGSIYLMGAVGSPGMVPYTKGQTLSTTIIRAGGVQKFAQVARVAIVRGTLTEPRIAEVNYQAIVTGHAPDVLLEPGDIVYVPLTPFRHVARLTEEIIDQFVRTVAVNEAIHLVEPKSQPAGTSFGILTPTTR